MFESCCTPYDVAHLLRARYGLPVRLDAHRPTVVCDARITALDVPAPLAARVLDALPDRPAPVITNPRGTVWTFLVHRTGPVDHERRRRLRRRGVAQRAPGRPGVQPRGGGGVGGGSGPGECDKDSSCAAGRVGCSLIGRAGGNWGWCP